VVVPVLQPANRAAAAMAAAATVVLRRAFMKIVLRLRRVCEDRRQGHPSVGWSTSIAVGPPATRM
jgi:hypothetical protein